MPLLVACNNDDKIGNDDQPTAAITIQDLAGEWHLTLVTPDEICADSAIIYSDGSYNYKYVYSPNEEGQYKPFYQYRDEGKYGPVIGGNLLIDNVTMSRYRYATTVDDIEDAIWDTVPENIGTDTLRASFFCQGSVLRLEYFNGPATPTSQDIESSYIYFRKGATNLPSDKSLLQGIWYCRGKEDAITLALRFSGDSIEIYDGNYKNKKLYKGTYTYKEGIASIGHNELFAITDGKDNINTGNPFDFQWQTAQSQHVENFHENGIAFAFIVSQKTAYSVLFDKGHVFTKQ
ncbi:MAG: hypothetical protein J6W18_10130 [Bacteroidaceae bacterium]|nr:hypothetical protein [Bacteroidaceae bacterium]